MDLGENTRLANDYWQPNAAIPVPSNQSNNLLSIIKEQYPGARNINQVTQVLEPLQAFGIRGGQDFEKVESARLLNSSEYTLNSTLGYISLKSAQHRRGAGRGVRVHLSGKGISGRRVFFRRYIDFRVSLSEDAAWDYGLHKAAYVEADDENVCIHSAHINCRAKTSSSTSNSFRTLQARK